MLLHIFTLIFLIRQVVSESLDLKETVNANDCLVIEVPTGSKFSYTVELNDLILGLCPKNSTRYNKINKFDFALGIWV